MEKKKKVIELEILDDMPMSGVFEIALVDKPAIETNWMAFRSEEFVNPRSGETENEFIGRCMSVLIGDEGKPEDQAAAICYSMWENNFSIDTSGLPPYVDEITVDDKKKKTMEFDTNPLDIFGYKTRHFEICPGAIATFEHLMEMNPDEETQGMIRSAALQADRVFEIEKEVLESESATEDDLIQATILVDDFTDLMGEIDEELGMEHDISYMLGHLQVIGSFLPEEFADVADLRVGDAVSWKVGGQNPRGRIREIIREGGKQVPGTGFVLRGTKDDPGYIIEIYTQQDGKWSPSGEYAGRKAESILKNVTLSAEKFSLESWETAVLDIADRLGKTAADFEQSGFKFAKYDPEDKLMPLQFAKGSSVYRYEGPVSSNTRRFCREMVGKEKYYTYSEITKMDDWNPGFGEGGSNTYSIWKYKGGPNCKHGWQKYYLDETGKYQNKGKAPGTAGEKPFDMPNRGYAEKMSKYYFSDEDQRIVVGPAMIPDMEILRKDKETKEPYYVKFSKEVIARIAEKFMREDRNNETNVNHDTEDRAFSYIVETWIVEHPEDKANKVYGLDLPVGSWVIKMRVADDDVWKKVKKGELKGFSIEGNFMSREEYEAYNKNRDKYAKILGKLKS
jgi:hypothetical protein